MRITKSKSREIAEGDMTPMIDMVFQLIAFFMMLINFTKVEQDQRVKLPLSELAKPPEVAYDKPITLQMTGDGEIIFKAAGSDLLDIDGLLIALKTEAEIIKATKTSLSEVTVVIRGDAEAPTGKVQDMIQAAMDAGFSTFALRSQQEKVRYKIDKN